MKFNKYIALLCVVTSASSAFAYHENSLEWGIENATGDHLGVECFPSGKYGIALPSNEFNCVESDTRIYFGHFTPPVSENVLNGINNTTCPNGFTWDGTNCASNIKLNSGDNTFVYDGGLYLYGPGYTDSTPATCPNTGSGFDGAHCNIVTANDMQQDNISGPFNYNGNLYISKNGSMLDLVFTAGGYETGWYPMDNGKAWEEKKGPYLHYNNCILEYSSLNYDCINNY
jgi:hypothetical protein